MSYEMIVGLEVKDKEIYKAYRQAMKPILEKYEGGFRYDFAIEKVLKNEEGRPINRVFVIYFKDKPSMKNFFSNAQYLEIKKEFFEASVLSTTIISEYERTP